MEKTIKEWAELDGIKPDTVRKAATRILGRTLGQLSILTEDEWQQYKLKIRVGQARTNKEVVASPATRRDPAAKEQPGAPPSQKEWRLPTLDEVRAACLDILLISLVAGHAALVWYDCATQWGTPGTIGGGIAFFVVIAALLLATDATRVRTSQAAIIFVLVVDVAAWWVHFPTFQTPRISDTITGVFAGFLCACSWISLYLYRDSKID